uniref:Uncharacterized protein n=1 Tax=Podoviridae sp. ctIlt3 TaxID=2825239 RepID=A0A8S5UA07_9CAUD|nr:MAG TPA: hypothetical protein [Podoviridae sp. ctIlt3]
MRSYSLHYPSPIILVMLILLVNNVDLRTSLILRIICTHEKENP